MPTTITPLPIVPSRSNAPDLFADRADAFLGALPLFQSQVNAVGVEIDGAGADAAAQVVLAVAQANIATTQASIATTKAGEANTSAIDAANSASSALISANNASSSFNSFQLQYLGSKTADPTLNNSGGALTEGQFYWNSNANELRFYNGSAWQTANLVAANYVVKTGDTMTGPMIVSVNSASTGLRITQAGTGNAFVVEDVASDTTPFVIDASGNTIIGDTLARATRVSTTSVTPAFQNIGTTLAAAATGSFIYDSTTAANSGYHLFARSRNATLGSHTVVVNGDRLGTVSFAGSDGTQFSEAARISVEVDGTPGANDMPGRMIFSTTADAGTTPTERLRIDSTGLITIPGTISLGIDLQLTRSDASGPFVGSTASAPLRLGTGNTERARIDTGGNFGIGVTPVTKLDINGNQSCNIVVLGSGAINCSLGNYFTITISANTTFSFTGVPATRAFSITVEVNHTAGTISFPASVSFPNSGTAPTLTAGKKHLLGFITSDSGTTWRLVSSTNYNT